LCIPVISFEFLQLSQNSNTLKMTLSFVSSKVLKEYLVLTSLTNEHTSQKFIVVLQGCVLYAAAW
jgi:hypothetical protein